MRTFGATGSGAYKIRQGQENGKQSLSLIVVLLGFDSLGQELRHFVNPIVRRKLEERGVRLGAIDIGQPVDRLAGTRVAVFGQDDDLQFWVAPALVVDLDRTFVAHGSSRDRVADADALDRDSLDSLFTQ